MKFVDWLVRTISKMAELTTTEIRLFRSFKKFNQTLGILSSQSTKQSYLHNLKRDVILLPMILVFISSASYLVFKAETIAECTQSSYVCVTALCTIIHCGTVCWKIENILKLIEKEEKFIQKSTFTDL